MKAILLPLIAGVLSAQTPTIDQSLSLKTAAAPRFSPDGRFITYEVSEANWEGNSFETQIWMAMPGTGERYQLTHSKKSSSDARWAPDSKRLSFLSDRDGSRQIYLISPAGGEATQLTHVEGGVQAYEWAPDGHRIAFTSSGVTPKAKAGDFETVDSESAMSQISVVSVDPKGENEKLQPEPLTAGSQFSVERFRWSPDSTRIAYSASREPGLSGAGTADLYVVRVADKSGKRLVDTAGADRNPVWSPDGKEIAYETANGRDHTYSNFHVAIVPADGGNPRVLAEAFDENPRLIDWAPAGIYFEAAERTTSHLFRMNPATGAVVRVSSPINLELSQTTFTQDFSHSAFICAWPESLRSEVCVTPVGAFDPLAGDQSEGSTQRIQAGHARAIRMEVERRHSHRGRPHQAS